MRHVAIICLLIVGAASAQTSPSPLRPALSAPHEGDRVTTTRGDCLTGHVDALEADGQIRLSGAEFAQPILLKAGAPALVELAPGPAVRKLPRTPPASILLAGGDRILGQVTRITSDVVEVHSDALGRIRLHTGRVWRVAFTEFAAPLRIATCFDGARTDPWQPDAKRWTQADQCLVNSDLTQFNQIRAAVPLLRQTRVEVLLQPSRGRPHVFTIALGTEEECAFVELKAQRFNIGYMKQGGHVVNSRPAPNETVRSLRLVYDTTTRLMQAWLDGVELRATLPADAPAPSPAVWLGAVGACGIASIHVTSAESIPEAEKDDPRGEGATVVFDATSRVSAAEVSVDDEVCHVRTAAGAMRIPVGKLNGIVFNRRPATQPETAGGSPVWVTTVNDDRLTLRGVTMDGGALRGASEAAGAMTIDRSAVRTLRFRRQP